MFLLDWFYGVLNYLGFGQKSAKVLFLGLDNAGKTTLMQLLAHGKVGQFQPTHHPGQEELAIGGVTFKAHDLGGHDAARKVWATYFPQVDAIVYLVDAADRERFPEAKKELDGLLTQESLANVPFLVLGNKIDMVGAAQEGELRHVLGLTETTGKDATGPKDDGRRPIELFMCSIMTKRGYAEGFKWLTKFI